MSLLMYLLLALMMCSAWIFSHGFVADQINKKSLQKQQLLQASGFDFDWQFFQDDDVISLFESQWFNNRNDFGFNGPRAQISLNMRGQSLLKAFHRQLIIDISGAANELVGLQVSIELSDPDNGLYYHSNRMPVGIGMNVLELPMLDWWVTRLNNQAKETIEWQAMERLQALVLRFSNPEQQQVVLNRISLPQLEPIDTTTEQKKLPCEPTIIRVNPANAQVFCWNSNLMNNLHQDAAASGEPKLVFFEPVTALNHWFWLVSSLVLALVTAAIYNKARLRITLLFVGLIYAFIALLHVTEISAVILAMQWLLVLVFLWLLWFYRWVFNSKVLNAAPVWILTVTAVALFLWFGQPSGDILSLLPMYLLWAGLQQILLGPVMTDGCQKVMSASRGQIAVMVALIFALIHSPNHTLMLATFTGGFMWSYSWQKYRNIYVNIISHSLLALSFYQFMPSEWLGSARIGIFF